MRADLIIGNTIYNRSLVSFRHFKLFTHQPHIFWIGTLMWILNHWSFSFVVGDESTCKRSCWISSISFFSSFFSPPFFFKALFAPIAVLIVTVRETWTLQEECMIDARIAIYSVNYNMVLVLCLVFERQSMLLSYIARGSYPLLPTPQLALSTPPAAWSVTHRDDIYDCKRCTRLR